MVAEVDVRAAGPADAGEVARLYVASSNAGFGAGNPRPLTDELVRRWAADLAPGAQRWWLAELDGVVVGFVGIGPSRDPVDPRLGELDTIAVDPDHWRRGIGRTLLRLAERELRADGYPEAILWTAAGYDLGHRFYAAMGWALDGGTRHEGAHVRFRRHL